MMKSLAVLFASYFCVVPAKASSSIKNLFELNSAITNATSDAGKTVGFLSQANYQSVQSVLEESSANGGSLIVKVFPSSSIVEELVKNGSLVAGLFTSCPSNQQNEFNLFGATIVAPRSSFFTIANTSSPVDSSQLREAWDAAIVRFIEAGSFKNIETQYYNSDGFDAVGAWTCGVNPNSHPFPPAGQATGLLQRVLSTRVLRVGALGPSNWGFQGNYQLTNPAGLWPDVMNRIFEQFQQAYGTDIVLTRHFHFTSADVMNDVLTGNTDLTEPYWTVPAFHNNEARTKNFDISCTVLGTESCFFTNAQVAQVAQTPSSNNDDDTFPAWAVAVIVVLGSLTLLGVLFTCFLISREKSGKPIFYTPLNERKGAVTSSVPSSVVGMTVPKASNGQTRGSIDAL
mmetsp:Transcript_21503/g.34694  ORF Transcript_21503/g.34694 Transcript_21503/m.34694 type:complete len:400 (+) Transcript_21503:41-1240(+)